MSQLDDIFGCETLSLSGITFAPSGTSLVNTLSALSKDIDKTKETIQNAKFELAVKDPLNLASKLNLGTFTQEYGELLTQSKSMIQVVMYLISNNSVVFPETITAASSFITSVRGLLQDMLELYRDYMKFQYSINLAKVRSELKKDEQKHRFELEKELINVGKGINSINSNGEELLEYRQSDVIDQLNK
jgi:hypothetical protein